MFELWAFIWLKTLVSFIVLAYSEEIQKTNLGQTSFFQRVGNKLCFSSAHTYIYMYLAYILHSPTQVAVT